MSYLYIQSFPSIVGYHDMNWKLLVPLGVSSPFLTMKMEFCDVKHYLI